MQTVNPRKIELLAPAKNAEIGMAAIQHGADAVYIGAPKFSARAAAGNTIESIAQLVTYAHRYNAKVYVALNTIFSDEELSEVQPLIHELYAIGVDALIIQDFGILQLDLPPIPLHASTQMDNRTLDKVKFLEECGFEQVVLARELSLEQITKITSQTNVAIECFVHGALCVSYSGQCFISQALRHRSANRGNCAQFCRLPYTLVDADGKTLISDKHLLSLKDLDLSANVSQLLEAGVRSFKIEGRLKDIDYVKNITAYYRQKLDQYMDGVRFVRASSGECRHDFTPNPQKSFYRGATSYFFEGRSNTMQSFDTPKSLGEPVGRLKSSARSWFTLSGSAELHNGDGLCALNEKGEWIGFRVNKVENEMIFPLEMPKLKANTMLYRNFDHEFNKIITKESGERKIRITMSVSENSTGFLFSVKDEDGFSYEYPVQADKVFANNATRAQEAWESQLGKLGGTPYECIAIQLHFELPLFVQASVLNQWRRELIDQFDQARIKSYKRNEIVLKPTTHTFPSTVLDYRGNVMNQKARDFFTQHGVTSIAHAFELAPIDGAELMRTKYCIKYSLGWCPKENKQAKVNEPLYLVQADTRLQLQFDCKACEMIVKRAEQL